MYCSKCGKQIADDAAFCSYCGQPVARQYTQNPAPGSVPRPTPRPTVPPKKPKQPIWVGAIVILLVFLAVRYLAAPLFLGKKAGMQEETIPTFAVPEMKLEQKEITIPTVPEIGNIQEEVTVPETTVPETTVAQLETTAPTETEAPETTAPQQDLSGSWEKVKIKKNSSTYNVAAFTLNRTLKNCTQMTIEIDVTMNANTSCKDWRVWVREKGTFKEAGSIYLPKGKGSTSQTVTFSPARSFDSIAVIPAVPGGYSWSLGIGLSDIICD